jgi:hypothetical protein
MDYSAEDDRVRDVQFQIVDPSSVSVGPTTDDGTGVPEDAPVVTFDGDAVRVVGRIAVGSSECKEASLAGVEYDESADELTVTVTDGKSPDHPDNSIFNRSCSDDMSSDGYEVTVTFDGPRPSRVVARERNVDGVEAETVES